MATPIHLTDPRQKRAMDHALIPFQRAMRAATSLKMRLLLRMPCKPPGLKTLAHELEASRDGIVNALRGLVHDGLIYQRGSGNCRSYKLTKKGADLFSTPQSKS